MKPEVILVKKEATAANCEALLAKLNPKKRQVLHLPSRFTNAVGYGEAAIIQFIITWAQQQKELNEIAEIITYIDGKNKDQIEKFIGRLPGLVAVLAADIVLNKQGNNIKEECQTPAINRMEELQGANPQKYSLGRSVEVLIADHLASLSSFLYYGTDEDNPVLKGREEFKAAGKVLFEKSIGRAHERNQQQALTIQDKDRDTALGRILYETIENTHDHARTEYNDNGLAISFRILKSLCSDIPSERIKKDIPPLTKFYGRQSPLEGWNQLKIFSISILDSGPGIVNRLRKIVEENIDEWEVFKKAFETNLTSKEHSSTSGKGLQLIIETLKEREGIIIVRTDNVFAYYDTSEKYPEWKKISEIQDTPHASGTLINFSFPYAGERN